MKRHYISLLLGMLALTGCFKDKLLTVGPPNDIDQGSITTPPGPNDVKRKVLFIGISGLRGDAMEAAAAPAISGLYPHAIYSFEAQTQQPTTSGSGWANLLNGVWSGKHGVKDNTFAGYNSAKYPMAFRYAKALAPHLRTISVQAWPAVNDLLVSQADVRVNLPDNDARVRDTIVARLGQDDPDVLLAGFTGVKNAAHQFGYGPQVAEYMQAVEQTDGFVGDILQAISKRPNAAKEDWLIIIASDHGGTDKAEGGSTPEERNIFTLFHNKAFNGKKVEQPLSSLRTVRFSSVNQWAGTNDPFYNFEQIKQFTVSVAVRTNGFVSDVPFIGNKDWDRGLNPGWLICPRGTDKWKFQAGDGNGRVDINSTGPIITDNRWHTLTITIDRRSGAGELQMYQDGEPCGSSSLNNLAPFAPNHAVKIAIGDDITGRYREFYGDDDFQVANIRIWDSVWTKEDMKKYAPCDTVQINNPYFSRMIGWWKATGPTGNILEDASPMNKPLTINGGPAWVTQELDFCNVALPAAVPQSVDVVPTIMAWLRIATDSGWSLDGINRIP